MHFIVDTDADVAIVAGDFLIFACTYSDRVKVHVSCGAFVYHSEVQGISDDLYFTPYGILPNLYHYNEFYSGAASSDSKICINDDMHVAISVLRRNTSRRWLPVSVWYRHIFDDYLREVMIY